MRALIITFALIATAYSVCIVNGTRYKDDEKWIDGDRNFALVKQCKKEKHGWKPVVVECTTRIIGFTNIPINTKVTKGGKTCYCEETRAGKGKVEFCCETKSNAKFCLVRPY